MSIFEEILRDYKAVFIRDPAARGFLDVIINYSGFHAIVLYRIIHRLWNLKIPILPRFLSQIVRIFTGVEIHPAAKIGAGFFIDHGTGVVIGETTEIGTECLIYQGVTLGGTGKEQGKRHPTLQNNVVIGAGAKILGSITIGSYAKIGANSVVLEDVPQHSIVVGIPAKIIKRRVSRFDTQANIIESLDHVHMPDPVEERFKLLEAKIKTLESTMKKFHDIEELPMRKGDGVRVYNTISAQKEDLIPIKDKHINMYVCGVTVYDYCHVGHARSAIVFDVIRRYLSYRGYDVKFIRNFTDIDDKIINRANELGIGWDELSKKYTSEFYHDMDLLGVGRGDIEPKATEHISEMIEIIAQLIESGYAYSVDGDVFYEIEKFKDYGKLSKKDISKLEAGSRVNVDKRKRNPFDFSLWKSSKPSEPSWESPWGQGRPGWHTECSAMSKKYLGETFDIHGGGADLIFPHHENEIAQSEALSGKTLANYWIHNGFITIDKEKMSKSLGNFFTIRDILRLYDPEVLRLFLISTHYRSPIEFSEDQLRDVEISVDRYYSTMLRVEEFLTLKGHAKKEPDLSSLQKIVSSAINRFTEVMDDDFNTAQGVGIIFELIREINRFLDTKQKGSSADVLIKQAMSLIRQFSDILGIFTKTPDTWQISLMKTKVIPLKESDIAELIENRNTARAGKDYAASDKIRADLDKMGIILEDRMGKTTWKVKLNYKV
ncbi:MAG: cysteine--tRNA ligase [Nitrospirae bacterium]|nr:cysteine--tRNA ligase [Nitrospirota bacterium]